MSLSLEEMKANRRKWVEALRSGEYEQVQDWLYCNGGYCCLGVLASIAGADDGDLNMSGTLGDFPGAMEFVGLSTDTADYLGGNALTLDNDAGKSFAEIADIIESEPPGLFVEAK